MFRWPRRTEEAALLQERDRRRIRIEPLTKKPRSIAGVDASFSHDKTFAAVCLYRYPDLHLLESTNAVRKTTFPYEPGYLFFREGPAIIAAVRKLSIEPDILLVDGQGVAHPRGIGSASHLGLILGIPAIGCAKTRFVGSYQAPGKKKGSMSELITEGICVGVVLRTQNEVKPLFVSAGHKIDLPGAIDIVLGCIGPYRIPEPLRCADMLSRKIRTAKKISDTIRPAPEQA